MDSGSGNVLWRVWTKHLSESASAAAGSARRVASCVGCQLTKIVIIHDASSWNAQENQECLQQLGRKLSCFIRRRVGNLKSFSKSCSGCRALQRRVSS